jgi:hypothetical protein
MPASDRDRLSRSQTEPETPAAHGFSASEPPPRRLARRAAAAGPGRHGTSTTPGSLRLAGGRGPGPRRRPPWALVPSPIPTSPLNLNSRSPLTESQCHWPGHCSTARRSHSEAPRLLVGGGLPAENPMIMIIGVITDDVRTRTWTVTVKPERAGLSACDHDRRDRGRRGRGYRD